MKKKTTTFFLLVVMRQCIWPDQCTKNIPQHLFGAIHLVRMYLRTDILTDIEQYDANTTGEKK